ncbi:substrate-binding domain-containing protein [Cryptosporangium phraense]|uniref:substrate-binding domain-containing protein n=1 Tax=Cryptosporangium phraense TaxID=2593070 RepID=UPI001479753A|nr:substrate-binding domain-containing protein [Cryptosporangium phraense]
MAALVTLILAGTTACSGAPVGGPGLPTVGLVVPDRNADELGLGYAAGVDRVGGVRSIVTGPSAVDSAEQVKMFSALRKRAGAGMALATRQPERFARPLAEAVDDGVEVMTLDAVPARSARVKLAVGNDDYALGTMLANAMLRRIPERSRGTVVLGTSSATLDARARGLRDRFGAQRSGVTLLGPFDTGPGSAANRKAWEALVAAHPDALAFLGTGEDDAYNLAAIRRRTHGLWLAGGFELNPRSIAALRQGELAALVSPERYFTGMVAGELQAAAARNKTSLPSGWIVTPGEVVTTSNVAGYEERQASAGAKQAWARPRVAAFLKDLRTHTRPLPTEP